MGYYQITNTTNVTFNSTSLTLTAGQTTIMVADQLPADLNDAIIDEELVVVKLSQTSGGGGSGSDVITNIATTTPAASLTSVKISDVYPSLLPPGRQIINNTMGDVWIRCAAGALDASLTNFDIKLEPNEECFVSADYLDEITMICESAVGTVTVKVFY